MNKLRSTICPPPKLNYNSDTGSNIQWGLMVLLEIWICEFFSWIKIDKQVWLFLGIYSIKCFRTRTSYFSITHFFGRWFLDHHLKIKSISIQKKHDSTEYGRYLILKVTISDRLVLIIKLNQKRAWWKLLIYI